MVRKPYGAWEGVSGALRGGPPAETNRLKPPGARIDGCDRFFGRHVCYSRPVVCEGGLVANSFGSDIIFETEDPQKAAAFYVEQLGFEVLGDHPKPANEGHLKTGQRDR